MGPIDLLESERLQQQERLDSVKSQAERNRLGQFATPTSLAVQILECAKSLLPPRCKVRFLDPALGTGAFYSALLKVFTSGRVASALGYEIDRHYGEEAARLWRHTGLTVRIADFTEAAPPPNQDEKPNLIVCNPPYVRHHHLSSACKRRLQQRTLEVSGAALNGLAGLYCHFLCLSHAWLAPKGIGGWLIPSEFMDVNYGRALKQYLLERVTLLRIHRFDPNEVQFGDALVSSAVVWLRHEPPSPGHRIEFTYGGSLSHPKAVSHVSADALQQESKWSRFPLARERTAAARMGPMLSDLFAIKRGLATGANGFFILSAEKARANAIPREFLTPILPSPRHLPVDRVQGDAAGRPVIDQPLFLLSCDLPEEKVKLRFPALWRYLERGRAEGVEKGYICRHRSPWYTQEERPPAPFLCTYMGRQGKRGSPFRFILNQSKATAANVYLLLYPRPALRKALAEDPELAERIWQALQRIPAEALTGEGRVYGGGLHKMEPNELAKAPAHGVFALLRGTIAELARQGSLF